VTVREIFGTDGIRGPAGEGWLSLPSVAAVGRVAGQVLGHPGSVALSGHDGRRSGPEIEAALCAGLSEAGVRVVSTGRITTPGLAWLTRRGHYLLGAMISASHNPSHDNGIKLFSGEGGKLGDDEQARIEERLWAAARERAPVLVPPPVEAGLVEAYVEHLTRGVCPGLSLAGLSVVVDCANGGGSDVAPVVLERLGADVRAIASAPDGDNINRGCGSTHPQALQAEVRRHGSSVGIALDGDGDRCILVDETGEIVHGDGIMTVVARHAVARGEYRDPRIVATVMSNRGLHRALREVGVSVVEVAVGDRAVVDGLRREGLPLGGEQSGHIVFGAENDYIGDGTVTALRVLRVMVETGRPLSRLASPYQAYPQVLLNVPVAKKPPLETLDGVWETVRKVEGALGDDGRVLLRYSGTESLARVMVEGPDRDAIERHAASIAERLQRELAR